MDIDNLKLFLSVLKQPKYRLDQIINVVFKQYISDWDEAVILPALLRKNLKVNIPLLSFKVVRVLVSKDKQAYKALLELKDARKIETVLLRPKPALWSCCLSTQVGCVMGCRFCATGMMGFQRHLTSEEITDQVLFWQQYLKKSKLSGKLNNIVFMGMGEPLANKENLFKSLKILMDSKIFAFSQRHLSVSTSGFSPGIGELAKLFPQVNLAVSINAPNDDLRSLLMPMNKKYPLKFLIGELRNYFKIASRKVFLEYILFSGINDSEKEADDLKKLVEEIGQPKLLQINLIAFNKTDSPYKSPTRQQVEEFKNYLARNGLKATIRRSLGQDISAACGQLAGT